MRVSASSAALVIVFTLVLGPSYALRPYGSLLQVQGYEGDTTGKYIVMLKTGVSKSAFLQEALGTSAVMATHEWSEGYMNGFACELTTSQLNTLRAHEDVDSIAEDGIAKAAGFVTQTNAPWGIARLSQTQSLARQNPRNLNFLYTYDNSSGAGVDIYVVDTGVYTNHSDFGGRARWGATFGPYPSQDTDGHGTHCAATAAGTRFGIAKQANIIAVKVLGNDNGTGTIADIVSGLEFVFNSSRASGRPSIASLSLGGSQSTPLDTAVAQLTSAGIHVVAAAGNSNVSAVSTSPARAQSAVTVGASSINDTRWRMSNFGSVVDIFAPGESIASAWIGSPNAVAITDGTSMAAPHISGLIAYLITLEGNLSPAQMKSRINTLALNNVLGNVPGGTPNRLAQNGGAENTTSRSGAVSTTRLRMYLAPRGIELGLVWIWGCAWIVLTMFVGDFVVISN